jgi:membrane associated rhomboid family serine protease
MHVELRRHGRTESLTVAEWESRVRAGRVPPDTEVRLPLLTGDAFLPASAIDGYDELRADPAQRWSSQIEAAPTPWMTALLAGVMVRLTATSNLEPTSAWLTEGARSTPHILESGEVWRWATMAVLHQAPEHLAFNLLGFVFAGWHLERVVGARGLAWTFGVSAAIGAIASTFASPQTLSIGASGGVFGVVAAAVALWISRPSALPPRLRAVFGPALGPYLVLGFLSGLSNARVDNAAHLGGLLTGLVLGISVRGSASGAPRLAPAVLAPLVTALLATAMFTVGWGPSLVPMRAAGPGTEAGRGARWDVPRGWDDDVSLDGKAASTSPATDARWSVAERTLPRILDLDDLGGVFFDDLQDRDVAVVWSTGEASAFAGLEGRCWTGRIEADAIDVHLCVARRGVHAIRGLWQVPEPRSHHLAALRTRLFDSVRLPEDVDAAAARQVDASMPLPAQIRALEQLAADGALDEALRRLDALPDTDPRVARATLRLLAVAGGRVPDADARIDRALAVDGTAPAVLDAARALASLDADAVGDALVRLAWRASPWDTALTEAHRARGGCTLRTPAGLAAAACPDAGPPPSRLDVAAARAEAERTRAPR